MPNQIRKTAIYLVCFHSAEPLSFADTSGQFRRVEMAIHDGEWPYDNGDDPSFYVARRGGLLTWGVCRQDLRNAIAKDSIVVFFSFTPLADDAISYRLCAVETVIDKIDHCAFHNDPRFTQFQHLYINALISPTNHTWRHGETDRRPVQQHDDWLWRITDHRGMKREIFAEKYDSIYKSGCFSESIVNSGKLRLASNYVVFSAPPDRAFISPNPPEVAIASRGLHEQWTHKKLRTMTVGKAASLLQGGRDYLRVANSSGRNVHRQIRFDMPAAEAESWRNELIEALKAASKERLTLGVTKQRRSGVAKC